MVATVETISEPELHGQRRRTSISSAPSVVKKSSSMNSGRGIWSTLIHREVAEVNGGPMIITDQRFGSSDDLFITHYSLVIERLARNRNYSPTLGRWINQDPPGYINGANTYQFAASNPIGRLDPLGLWTLSLGLAINWQIFGLNINYSGGLVVDSDGHAGGYIVGGGGVGAGAGGTADVSVRVSNAKTICDLRGPYGNVNAGIGDGVGVEGNGFAGQSPDGNVVGGGVTIGAGLGGGWSVGETGTGIFPMGTL